MPQNNISIIGLDCTGCGSCEAFCPKHAISMQLDNEGFWIPSVDNTCIDCGACLKICHTTNNLDSRKSDILSYAAVTQDEKLYKKSASGAIFGTIARDFLQLYEGGYICGAAYVDNEVKHILINRISDIVKLQNSKYVQSNTNGIFVAIKLLLKKGIPVLFSGTPCQVAGLKNYTKGINESLYTIDIICHGVPSPLFLKRNIANYYNLSQISNIVFRWKNALFKKSAFFLCLSQRKYGLPFPIRKIVSSNSDPYFSAFMKNGSFRYSCYRCHYANLNRVGDITIGDCDSSNQYPNFHKKSAVSTVIINTDQGVKLWDKCKSGIDYIYLDIEKEASVNHQLKKPAEMPEFRNTIYLDLVNMDASDFRKKYGRIDPWYKEVLFQILDFIPYRFV